MEADLFAEMRLAAERGNGNLRFLPALMLGRRASGCPRVAVADWFGTGGPGIQAPVPSPSARRSLRSTFPIIVFGSSSRISMLAGTL